MCIMLTLVPLKLDSDQELIMNTIYLDLQEYREGLKEYIGIIEEEITDKEAELDNLDEKLIELERQYNRLLEENKKVSDKLNSLEIANNHHIKKGVQF